MDEPCFKIRGRDALGPSSVDAWAAMAEIAAKGIGSAALAGKALDARNIAQEMRDWQAAHPEQVKYPD